MIPANAGILEKEKGIPGFEIRLQYLQTKILTNTVFIVTLTLVLFLTQSSVLVF